MKFTVQSKLRQFCLFSSAILCAIMVGPSSSSLNLTPSPAQNHTARMLLSWTDGPLTGFKLKVPVQKVNRINYSFGGILLKLKRGSDF